jgi:hypothetical protein
MSSTSLRSPRALGAALALALLPGTAAFAQVTPAAGYVPPDDTPAIKVGTVIYANYTYQDEPTAKDADGNTIHPSSFEVSRAYINVTGNLHHLLSFRVTPDIGGRFATSVSSSVTGGVPGEKVTTTGSTNYDGSLVFRLKYAFGQFNLDDWAPKGSWIRLGQQQTPYLDFMEGIYRYRWQGTIFPEREGYITSSDPGISAHFSLPNNYGDAHFGVYNGDGYSKAEANNQKSFQIRGTLRPLPHADVIKGLRLTAFYDADHYVKNGPRDRFIGSVTFEHHYVNLGFDYLDVKDRTSGLPTGSEVQAQGWSIWVTPRTKVGLEGLFRYDDNKPAKNVAATAGAHRKRTIAGVAYWFKSEKKDSAAIMADWEKVDYDAALAKPNEKRFIFNSLFTF